MYAGRKPGGGNSEFLLLDVTSGQARFSADLGSGMFLVSTISKIRVSYSRIFEYISTFFTLVFQRIRKDFMPVLKLLVLYKLSMQILNWSIFVPRCRAPFG